eukprot:5964493-Amphidinium_carterae.1
MASMDAGEDWTPAGKQKRPVGRPRNEKQEVTPARALENCGGMEVCMFVKSFWQKSLRRQVGRKVQSCVDESVDNASMDSKQLAYGRNKCAR